MAPELPWVRAQVLHAANKLVLEVRRQSLRLCLRPKSLWRSQSFQEQFPPMYPDPGRRLHSRRPSFLAVATLARVTQT